MPELARLLTPQIQKRAAEILDENRRAAQAAGPAPSANQNVQSPGYLHTLGAPPYQPTYPPTNAIRAKPFEAISHEGYDPRLNPLYDAAAQYAAMPGGPGYLNAFRGGVIRGFNTVDSEVPIPSAPLPVVEEAPPMKNKRGQIVLSAAPGAVFGMTESGQPTDIRGKKLGYLDQSALVTPYGDVALRTAEKRKGDVAMGDQDAFAQATLEQLYGPHLKELQDNGGKFPPGYFRQAYDEAQKKKTISKDTSFEDFKTNLTKGIQEMSRRENMVKT